MNSIIVESDDKEIMSKNLTRLINLWESKGKMRTDIAEEIGVPLSSLNSWARGAYYPRMSKIEALARYFGCTKTDLIEEGNSYKGKSNRKKVIINDITELINSMNERELQKLKEYAVMLLK